VAGHWQKVMPVTDPSALATDRVVVVQGCRVCGKNHIHVLGNPLPGQGHAPGVWFTRTKEYHGRTSDALDLRPAFREQRLFMAEPGSLLEQRMAEDPENAFAWDESLPGVAP